MKNIELKLGDIYHFNFSAEEYAKEGYRGSLNHCFEGLLIVMEYPVYKEELKKYEKELHLVDTFWGINRTDNKHFSLEEANKRGTLKYYCNFNEIEKVERDNINNYNDKDLFRLSTQHACDESCIYWYKKIGAVKSPKKKIEVLQNKINEEKHNINFSIRQIEIMTSEIKQLEIKGFDN